VKDLNIPWSKLFTPPDPPGEELHPTSRHTAMSTLLMDDSPRKADVQPYNHLCVKEYSNIIRNRDLASLLEERARVKSPSPPPPTEEPESQTLHPPPPLSIPHSLVSSTIHHQHPTPFNLPPAPLNPPPGFQFDQSVGIQPGATLLNPLPFTSNTGGYPRLPVENDLGHGVIAPRMLFKNPPPSMMSYQDPQAFQQLSRSTNPFASPQQSHHSQLHPHPPLPEAPAQPIHSAQGNPLPLAEITVEETKLPSDPLPSTSASKKRKRKGKRETEDKAPTTEPVPEIEYDETLLAVIGILNEVKHQSNVASWVKANGLWGPYPPQSLVNPNIDPSTDDPSGSREGIATLSDSGSVDSGRHGEGKKRRRDAVAAFFEASVTDGSPRAPTAEEQNPPDTPEAPLWFDNPSTMRHWVGRGRNALETLGIPLEHGLKQ
jgi:hypothetical protein